MVAYDVKCLYTYIIYKSFACVGGYRYLPFKYGDIAHVQICYVLYYFIKKSVGQLIGTKEIKSAKHCIEK